MRILKNRLIAAAGVSALVLVIAIVAPRRGEAQFASPVRVTNSLAQWVPNRDTDHPARNPFRKNFQLTIQNNDRAGDIRNVPLGFRLVVETFSANVQVPVGEKVQLEFTSTVTSNGTAVASDTAVPAFFQGTFGGVDFFFANQPMRIYVDPTGNTLSVSVRKTTANGTGFADITISGYLVPIP
jgi:hypothetical protein